MAKKPSEIARRAACLLEEVGWARHELYFRSEEDSTKIGSMCMLGALDVATAGTLDYVTLQEREKQLVAEVIGNTDNMGYRPPETQAIVRAAGFLTAVDLTSWNDERADGKEEVIARLRAAATKLESEGL